MLTITCVGFVAYVLTTLPSAELENKKFRIEGDRATLLEVAEYLGSDTKVEHVESFSGPVGPFKIDRHKIIEEGRGSTGWDQSTGKEGTGSEAAGSSNNLWPGHRWMTIKDYFARQ